MSELTAGPRQTVTRVIHPQRGEGVAVCNHGPSFFRPDNGEPIAMRVRLGGASSTGSPRDPSKPWSWVRLFDPEHGEVKAEVLEHGDRHDRCWSPLWGDGWLVWRRLDGMRFDADAGTTHHFEWNVVSVGTPEYVARQKRTRKDLPMSDEDKQWTTFNARDGMVYPFRKSAPPAKPVAAEPAKPAQGELFR